MSEESVKNERLDGSVKRGSDKPRRKRYCPFCGNEMHSRIIGSHVFCDKCHRRMPWTITQTDDKPIKPL